MTFDGFITPTKNWFPMPNNWTDITANIKSLAELKVVEYVMRHTWGFQEFGIKKAITTDEFMHGRMRVDGKRMDRGTGLSNRSVIDGLRAAEDHGYLISETDNTDMARQVKYYMLKMAEPDVKNLHTQSDVKNLHSGCEDVTQLAEDTSYRRVDSSHRSEKETIERNYRKKPKKESGDDANASHPPHASFPHPDYDFIWFDDEHVPTLVVVKLLSDDADNDEDRRRIQVTARIVMPQLLVQGLKVDLRYESEEPPTQEEMLQDDDLDTPHSHSSALVPQWSSDDTGDVCDTDISGIEANQAIQAGTVEPSYSLTSKQKEENDGLIRTQSHHLHASSPGGSTPVEHTLPAQGAARNQRRTTPAQPARADETCGRNQRESESLDGIGNHNSRPDGRTIRNSLPTPVHPDRASRRDQAPAERTTATQQQDLSELHARGQAPAPAHQRKSAPVVPPPSRSVENATTAGSTETPPLKKATGVGGKTTKKERVLKVVLTPEELLAQEPQLVQSIVHEWVSIFKMKPITETMIKQARELARWNPEPGEIKACRLWMYATDKNKWYTTHGMDLGHVVKEFERFQSFKDVPVAKSAQEHTPDASSQVALAKTKNQATVERVRQMIAAKQAAKAAPQVAYGG